MAVFLFVAFILTTSAVVWGVLDKTGEVDNYQNDDYHQNDATAADMVKIHLNNLFRLIQKF